MDEDEMRSIRTVARKGKGKMMEKVNLNRRVVKILPTKVMGKAKAIQRKGRNLKTAEDNLQAKKFKKQNLVLSISKEIAQKVKSATSGIRRNVDATRKENARMGKFAHICTWKEDQTQQRKLKRNHPNSQKQNHQSLKQWRNAPQYHDQSPYRYS